MVNTRQGSQLNLDTPIPDLTTPPPSDLPTEPQTPAADLAARNFPGIPGPLPGADILQAPRAPRVPAPPDLQEVLTQQAEALTALLRHARQPAAAPQEEDIPADPEYNWELLAQPSKTNFPVPSLGRVQRMATSLLTRLPTLTGRDHHEATFVLQMASMWPDLTEPDRKNIFQRLNVYAIVASVGWPTATKACSATSTPSLDFYLPPGVTVEQAQPIQRYGRTRRQETAPAPQPAPPQNQQQPANQPRRQQQQQRGGGAAGRGRRRN